MAEFPYRVPGLLAAIAVAGLALTGCAGGDSTDRIEDHENTSHKHDKGDADKNDKDDKDDQKSDEGDFAAPEEQSVMDLKVGDCIPEQPEAAEYSTMEVVPCSQPHEYEVFYDFELTTPDFDQSAIEKEIEGQCYGKPFEDFVGLDYNHSSYDVMYLSPTASGWTSGDRVVSCMIYEVSGTNETTGSLGGTEK